MTTIELQTKQNKTKQTNNTKERKKKLFHSFMLIPQKQLLLFITVSLTVFISLDLCFDLITFFSSSTTTTFPLIDSNLSTRGSFQNIDVNVKLHECSFIWKASQPFVSERCGPSVVIPGCEKCGTTALARALSLHPSVRFPKEIHFFDRKLNDSILENIENLNLDELRNYYISYLPCSKEIQIDKTPIYLVLPSIAKSLHLLFPNITTILILRDPVSRAVSAYHMVKFKPPGRKILPVDQYLQRQLQQFLTCCFEENIQINVENIRSLSLNVTEECFLKCASHTRLRFNLILRGLYYFQLRNWLKYFPRSHMFVLRNSAFRPPGTLACSQYFWDYFNLDPFSFHENKQLR
jgi:hypothetical protein